MKTPIIAILIAAACTDRAAFEPTNPTGQGLGGQPAASYDVRVDSETDPHVRVNVWSRGAVARDRATVVGLAIEVRNTGDRPVRLDPEELRLDAYTSSGAAFPEPRLARIESSSSSVLVPPGEATTVRLQYAMPPAVDPDRIASLRLRWAIDHEDGKRYVQFTDFARVPEQLTTSATIYYDPVFGYYDPFLYGYGYGYHSSRRVPVGRVMIRDRDRPAQHARRGR